MSHLITVLYFIIYFTRKKSVLGKSSRRRGRSKTVLYILIYKRVCVLFCVTVTDPRIWTKEDVTTFVQWAEIEFDLPRFDTELFQMNGKALCLLTKQDLGERCPGAGDLLYNVLQLLRRGGDLLSGVAAAAAAGGGHHLPGSPVASHFPFSPTWCLPAPTSPAVLSPAPSVDSQSDSPRHMDYHHHHHHQQQQQPPPPPSPATVGHHHLTPSVSIFPTTPTVGGKCKLYFDLK